MRQWILKRKVILGLKAAYSNILKVQKTDSEIDEHKKSLANINEKTEYGQIQHEVERLSKIQAQLSGFNKDENRILDKLNGELDILIQKIKSEEKKLFSGTVTNPKELAAIQQEIESFNRKRDELETSTLEQMDKISTLEEKLGVAEEKINANRQKGDIAKKVWLEKEDKLKEEISQLGQRRKDEVKDVDKELLADYEDIRARKDGIGAGALIGDTCQVCHVALAATDLERIKNKDEPDYCSNCGRILIVSDK